MNQVLFTVKYSINPDKREQYLDVVRELKNLMKYEGLAFYSVFEDKKTLNKFEELYLFESEEAFGNFEDVENERIDILMSKLSDLIEGKTTQVSTMTEIEITEEV